MCQAHHPGTISVHDVYLGRTVAVGGEGAKAMAEAFRGREREVLCVPRWIEGAEWLEDKLRSGDGLLVKGSRGIGLDGLVAWLRARRGL